MRNNKMPGTGLDELGATRGASRVQHTDNHTSSPQAPKEETASVSDSDTVTNNSRRSSTSYPNAKQNVNIEHITDDDLVMYEIKRGRLLHGNRRLKLNKYERKKFNVVIGDAIDLRKTNIRAVVGKENKLRFKGDPADSDQIKEIRRHIDQNRADKVKLEEMLDANKSKMEKFMENPVVTAVTSVGGLLIGLACMYPMIQPMFAKSGSSDQGQAPQSNGSAYPYGAAGY